MEVFDHHPQDVDLVGIADEPAVKQGIFIQTFREVQPVVKEDGAADGLTFGRVKSVENPVTIELPDGQLGVIFGVGITEGPVLPILRETAQVMKKSDHCRDPVVIFAQTKSSSNLAGGLADTKGVLGLQIQAVLVQGVIFVEAQGVLAKPVLKEQELRVIHEKRRYGAVRRGLVKGALFSAR